LSFPQAQKLKQFAALIESGEQNRQGAPVQGSTVGTKISKLKGFAAHSLVDSAFSGSLPFVAVVQPTDLRQLNELKRCATSL
jgi:hypothetical protein